MLEGLGCDMIEVERIRQALSRPSFLRRVYTLEERAAIARKARRPRRASGRPKRR